MNIKHAAIQSEILRNAVLITGAPRSGTTLLGKLISSLEGLEYHFEPPSLYMIASAFASGELPIEAACPLLTVYLAEDLLLESVHGRGVNLRPADDSQILNRISWHELNERWQKIANRNDAIDWVRTKGLRLALKMPNIFDSLPLMRTVLPDFQLVVSVRNGSDVVRSIIRKGWVSDRGLEKDLWPYWSFSTAINIPYWVKPEYRDRWPYMTEASRACLMWTCHAEMGLAAVAESNQNNRMHQVRYEDLLSEPWPVVETLAATLGCHITHHTKRWVDAIRTPPSMSKFDKPDFAVSTDKDILERFNQVNILWGY